MTSADKTPVAILCGGRGTRMGSGVESAPPKPLARVAGREMVAHVVDTYARNGFSEFVLAIGHRGDEIARWADAQEWPAGIEVTCLDTGPDSSSGVRVAKLRSHFGRRRFCLGYSDGLANVDLACLLDFHDTHGAVATMTVVRPELQFGLAVLGGVDDSAVVAFDEKPPFDGWVNAGFFVFESEVDDYLSADAALEREPLSALAAAGELRAFRHEGFWRCLDTQKDLEALESLSGEGVPPWLEPAPPVTPDLAG